MVIVDNIKQCKKADQNKNKEEADRRENRLERRLQRRNGRRENIDERIIWAKYYGVGRYKKTIRKGNVWAKSLWAKHNGRILE